MKLPMIRFSTPKHHKGDTSEFDSELLY